MHPVPPNRRLESTDKCVVTPGFYKPSFRAHSAAFTLIELLIVVAIMAIIASLAVPMLKATDSSKLGAAAGVLVSDMEFAQAESITHSDSLRVVVFSTSVNNSYSLATAASTSTPITNPIGKLPYVVTFGQGAAAPLTGVTISSYSLNGDNILGFGMYGQLDQATNATVTLASGSNTITITLDATSGAATVGPVQ